MNKFFDYHFQKKITFQFSQNHNSLIISTLNF